MTNSRTTDSSLKILVRIFKQIFQIKNQEKRCILQHETDLTFFLINLQIKHQGKKKDEDFQLTTRFTTSVEP